MLVLWIKYWQSGRRQEDGHQRVSQIGIGRRAGADGRGALHVDVEQHVAALAELVQHFGLGRAVTVVKYTSVFQK
jgi:hypothetical protein